MGSAHQNNLEPEHRARHGPDGPAPEATAPYSPIDPRHVRTFWRAVVILNVVILFGLAAVFARMFYLASQSDGNPGKALIGIQPDVRLPLPPGAEVKTVSLAGDRLAVLYEVQGRASVAIIELATGKVSSTIAFGATTGQP